MSLVSVIVTITESNKKKRIVTMRKTSIQLSQECSGTVYLHGVQFTPVRNIRILFVGVDLPLNKAFILFIAGSFYVFIAFILFFKIVKGLDSLNVWELSGRTKKFCFFFKLKVEGIQLSPNIKK